eukprot:m.167492 g.167492  ORF g.167492 m.167492 type:complete len:249 (-) comp15305_c1_seq13:987-1733(-)
MVCNHLQNNGDLAELQPGFIVRFQPVPGYTADRKEWWNVEVDPEGHSKGMYILRQIEELEKIRNRSGVKFKAIVFSDFRQSLATICDKIIRRNIQRYDNVAVNTDGELLSAVSSPRRGGQAYAWQNTKGWRSVADYATPEKQSIRELELERFTSDPDCNVLLLGTKHTDGLDLSVATHVFIVDEIWDQAVWTQVLLQLAPWMVSLLMEYRLLRGLIALALGNPLWCKSSSHAALWRKKCLDLNVPRTC